MKYFAFLTSCLLPLLSQAGFRESSTPASFSAYVHAYASPQLLESNGAAFDARLKLLDAAPKGAHARIATFEFDNGAVVRRLARHVCLAAARGVRVELLVDSKSGDRAGQPDAFDTIEDRQVSEELYQYMANCGAEILIFNHFEAYVSVLGQHVPNLFGDPLLNGTTVDPVRALLKLNEILDHVATIANEELARAGSPGVDAKPILTSLKNAALELLQVSSELRSAGPDSPPSGLDVSIRRLQDLYGDLLGDEAWDKVAPSHLRAAIPRILARFRTDPVIGPSYAVIRRFNRLQHRKLFLVENGLDGCAILGGRNLGDKYLADDGAAFIDGDVLLCRHQSADASSAVSGAGASFEELKTDFSDPSLRSPRDVQIRLVPRNPSYAYAKLLFPPALAPPGLRRAGYDGKLPAASRTLLGERAWRDEAPVLGEAPLDHGTHWRVLRSGWNPAEDEVRTELLRRIGNETQEVYLETAYAELGPDLRAALEGALARGVHVRLVTNSFFVSDGASKLIRPLMAPWLERTQAKFGPLFQTLLTTLGAGAMIHFKGAAFSCQKNAGGFSHSYLLGSHNFDQRAGRSDKENSLAWDEPVVGCNARDSAEQRRGAFYQSLSDRLHAQVLSPYRGFHAELEAGASESGSSPNAFADRWMSSALRQIFFLEGERSYKVKNAERVGLVMRVSEQGGLSDLLGLLL